MKYMAKLELSGVEFNAEAQRKIHNDLHRHSESLLRTIQNIARIRCNSS